MRAPVMTGCSSTRSISLTNSSLAGVTQFLLPAKRYPYGRQHTVRWTNCSGSHRPSICRSWARGRPQIKNNAVALRMPRIVATNRSSCGAISEANVWIARAKAADWQTYGYVEVYGRIAYCSMWNPIVEWQIRNGMVDSVQAIVERQALSAEWPMLFDAPPTRRNDGRYSGYGCDPFAGPIFVLVDRRSGSSGERAAIDLQRALGAVLVGEPTAGAMQYTEMRRFVFPQTGVQCTVPTKRQ